MPYFCIELISILMKHVLLLVIYTTSGVVSVANPPILFLQLVWLVMALSTAANNSTLQCPMVQGDDNIIHFWGWLIARYESGAKIDPLK